MTNSIYLTGLLFITSLSLCACGGGTQTQDSDIRVNDPPSNKNMGADIDKDTPMSSRSTNAASLFLTKSTLDRTVTKSQNSNGLFFRQNQQLESRARHAMSLASDPFRINDVTNIIFGWCAPVNDDEFRSLKDATAKFQSDSDGIRSLALNFVINKNSAHADKAVEVMMDYGRRQTLINLNDLDVDYRNATLLGSSDTDYCDDMPWNFALDTMWQVYGLINISDAYLLLKSGGYALTAHQDDAVREWILATTEAVNSSFQAWTRWADLHPNSRAYRRYRSDNHLSWALLGLLAAATALEDDELARYVLNGGAWTDRRSSTYTNPSSIRQLIDLAIARNGIMYEEQINRDPPIGYSLFHLWPMVMIAQIAESHHKDDGLWTYTGADGAGIYDAFDRYANFLLGSHVSPLSSETPERLRSQYGWLFEFAIKRWDDTTFKNVLDSIDRNKWITQGPGPAALIIAE